MGIVRGQGTRPVGQLAPPSPPKARVARSCRFCRAALRLDDRGRCAGCGAPDEPPETVRLSLSPLGEGPTVPVASENPGKTCIK